MDSKVRPLFNLLLIFGALGLFFLVLKIAGSLAALAGLIVLFCVGVLFFHRDYLMGAIVVSAAIMLQDPIKQQSISMILMLVYMTRWLSPVAKQQELVRPAEKEYYLLLLFGIVAFLTGVHGGFLRGVAFLGETLYIWVIIIPIFLLVISTGHNIFTSKRFKRLIPLVVLASGGPLLLEILIARGHMVFTYLLYMINLPINRLVSNIVIGDFMMRYRSGYLFALLLACLALLVKRYRSRGFLKYAFFVSLVALSFYVTMLTGYRKNLVGIVFLLIVGGWLVSSHKASYFMKTIIIGIVSLIVLYSVAGSLPYNMQRQLTILPGIKLTDQRAITSAEISGEGRFKLYQYSLEQAARDGNLLIGRGLVAKISDLNAAQYSEDSIGAWRDFFTTYTKHNYHSMLLQLMIDNGVLGALLMISFLAIFMIKRLRFLVASEDSMGRDVGLVMVAAMGAHNLVYLTFTVSFFEFYMYNILLVILVELSAQQVRKVQEIQGIEVLEEKPESLASMPIA